MHPTAHMSTPTPYILAPNRSSGERYHLGRHGVQFSKSWTRKANTTLHMRWMLLGRIKPPTLCNQVKACCYVFTTSCHTRQNQSLYTPFILSLSHLTGFGYNATQISGTDRKIWSFVLLGDKMVQKHRPGNDLMCVDSVGAAKRFGQTKISQLQNSVTV